MKVSILIPTLNRLSLLKESLDSARRQTYADLEILISDDGSTDGSRDYVRLVSGSDPRVHLLPPNPYPGLFDNINYLVEQSTGDAFCILADDDLLLPEFVERLVVPLREDEQVGASFCDHWLVNAAGEQLNEETDRHAQHFGRAGLPRGEVADALAQAMKGTMCMGFSLYRASVFRQELFDLTCGGAADFDYAIRAAQLGKLFYVKERLGQYRVHSASATATRPAYMIDGIIHVFNKYSFSEPRHERMRREILRSKYRIKLLYISVLDRQELIRTLNQYVKIGGQPLNPKIMLSLLFAMLPRFVAKRIKFSLKSFDIRHGYRLARVSSSM